MTYRPTSLQRIKDLSRLVCFLGALASLTACDEEVYRGVLVAKFMDGSARFFKRIAISSIDGPALNLALASKTKRCELIAPVPAGALSGVTDCKEISGVAELRCDGEMKRHIRWQMTSCHSGFGRSLEGTEPAILFGFSGNVYTAQNQLNLANETKFEWPANACSFGITRSFPDECIAGSVPPLPQFLDLTIESK